MQSKRVCRVILFFMQVFPTIMEKESSAKSWTAEIMVVQLSHYVYVGFVLYCDQLPMSLSLLGGFGPGMLYVGQNFTYIMQVWSRKKSITIIIMEAHIHTVCKLSLQAKLQWLQKEVSDVVTMEIRQRKKLKEQRLQRVCQA